MPVRPVGPVLHPGLVALALGLLRPLSPIPQTGDLLVRLAALVRLLGRPVFRAELHHARMPIPEGLPRAECSEEERRVYRSLVPARWPRIEVARSDPLYAEPPATGHVQEVIRRTLLSATEATGYAWDAEPRGKQSALPLEGP